MDFNS